MHPSTISQFLRLTELTRAQLDRLDITIRIHLNYPENQVGREGRMKHNEVWDIWLDGFIGPVIDAANVGGREAFWSAGSESTIRKMIRTMVREAASSIRNYLGKGTLPGWMITTTYPPREQGITITDAGPREPDPGSESSHADSSTDSSESEGSENKEESSHNSLPHQPSGRPYPMSAKKRRKIDPTAPFSEKAPTASTTSSTLRQPVTFLTRLQIPNTDVVRHEFIDTVGIVTLADFMQMLRESNGMPLGQHIRSFEVDIGGRTVDIEVDDPESEWEWGLVLGILHFSGVPDGQKAYVDIRVDE